MAEAAAQIKDGYLSVSYARGKATGTPPYDNGDPSNTNFSVLLPVGIMLRTSMTGRVTEIRKIRSLRFPESDILWVHHQLFLSGISKSKVQCICE